MNRLYIKTFGCQMNVYDSAKIAGSFVSDGYTIVDSPENADVVVVNTCSVRAKPDNKAFSFIGKIGSLKRKGYNILLAVAGCISQRDGEKLIKRFPFIDVVAGTFNYFRVKELVELVKHRGGCVVEILDSHTELEYAALSSVKPVFSSDYVGYVTVQRGCNRFCSYCIVPYLRGRERSIPPEVILKEVKLLSDAGVKEVHLLGQNVDFYGADSKGTGKLPELLELVCEVGGIERVRFMTSHPSGFSEELAFSMKRLSKVCEYVHLPPQSGSNKILKLMNRGYTREEYIDTVQMIRSLVPGVSISGDFIVGFPGESTRDFEETLKLVEICEFDQAFVFKYSPRPMTRASKYRDDVPPDEKTRRFELLTELLREIAERKNLERLGSVEKVLVEGYSPRSKDRFAGRTRDNKLVIFDASSSLLGKIVDVKINSASAFFLEGELVNNFAGVAND